MGDLLHTRNCFASAVTVLALHPGRINERLAAANKELQFTWATTDEEQALAEDILEFHHSIVRGAPDLVDAHLMAMSEHDATAAAQQLLDLASRLDDAVRANQRSTILNRGLRRLRDVVTSR